ncbi:MAG: peptide deformylase [Pseudomonadales bacterium]
MALLKILEFPDPRLRTKAKPIDEVTARHQRLADDMLETMYNAPGIGLAATQVNVHERLIVIDVSEDRDTPLVFINPSIEVLGSDLRSYEEGCLSVPDFQDTVKRPANVRVTALGQDGKPFVIEPDDLLAVCIQHEMDHLNGKLFVDYLSSLKRQRIRRQLAKRKKA